MRLPVPLRSLLLLPALAGIAPAAELDLSDPLLAEPQLEELVAAWREERTMSDDDRTRRQLAVSLQALGVVERQAGKAAEALSHLDEARDLLAGMDDPALDLREARALAVQDLGRLGEAEAELRKVLDRRAEGPATARAITLDHLAFNLLLQGRYPEVPSLLDEAEACLPPGPSRLRAGLRVHRGRLHHTLGSHREAIRCFEQAREQAGDHDEAFRLSLLSQLAVSRLRAGESASARLDFDQAADTARRLYAERSPFQAVPHLNNLGVLALAEGDIATARQSFDEALALLERHFGPDHASLILALNNLGVAEQLDGNLEQAEQRLLRAVELQQRFLDGASRRVAETWRNLARNSWLAGADDTRERVDRATREGLAVLERMIREFDPDRPSPFGEHQQLNFLDASDLVSLPCATGDPDLIAGVLHATKARLLDTLLHAGSSELSRDWRKVQDTLDPTSAFVDAVRYRSQHADSEFRYGAIVLASDGPPRWVELGGEARLTELLAQFRQRLARIAGQPPDDHEPPPLPELLRALHEDFWQPIERHLDPAVEHLAFSPDGALHFLPLPALIGEDGRVLCDRLEQLVTVTSGRELLQQDPGTSLTGQAWTVFSVADFPAPPVDAEPVDRLGHLLAGLGAMPGARDEAERIARIAPEGTVQHRDEAATESALRDLDHPPAVLHLACHAFSLHDPVAESTLPLDFDENPHQLRSSGLVLHRGVAQATRFISDSDPDDDLLFPREIARLRLQGTRLVTLSSCDSGAGTPLAGEGVLGLRRAFTLAGARETVVSLWPVSDRSTPAFMDRFYRLAAASDRPGQALWQTQREFLTAAQSDRDFQLAVLRYAPFVLGQSGPLRPGPAITLPVAERPPSAERDFPWWLVLAAVPLLLFLLARLRPVHTPTDPED